MIKLLFSLSFVAVTAFYSNQVNSQVTVMTGDVTNPLAMSCTNTFYTVAGVLAANNYPYMGPAVNVVAFNITVDLDYLSGFAPIYVTTPFAENVDLGVLPAGVYTVTTNGIIDGNLSSTIIGTMTVVECCNVIASYTQASQTTCDGDAVSFTNTSTGAVAYSWYQDNVLITTATNPSILPSIPGLYAIKLVADDGNCQDSVETALEVYALPTVDLGLDTTICNGDSIIFDVTIANGSYLWQDNSNSNAFTAWWADTFSVTVTDGNLCVGYDTIVVSITTCTNSISEVGANENIKLYPNPTSLLINIEGIDGSFTVSIYNLMGGLVFTESDNETINVSFLDGGTYLVEVNNKGALLTKRINILK